MTRCREGDGDAMTDFPLNSFLYLNVSEGNICKTKTAYVFLKKHVFNSKAITFTIASKRIQYLGINLAKGLEDLYNKNDKTLPKEIKDDTN